MKRGEFKVIHDDVIQKMRLTNITIKQRTILSRIYRNSLHIDKCQNKATHLIQIEPLLLQVALWKQDAGQPITPFEGIDLANSLIDGKPIQTKLKKIQASIKIEPTGVVSAKFWQRFVEQNSEELEMNKGHRVTGNRTE